MDIAGLSAVSVVWPVSATARSTTTDTATGSTGNDSTGLADRGRPGDNPTRATARPVDPDLPTGPPPTFSTTPLELEGDWQVLLARISAAGYAQMQAMAPPSDSAQRRRAGRRAGCGQTRRHRTPATGSDGIPGKRHAAVRSAPNPGFRQGRAVGTGRGWRTLTYSAALAEGLFGCVVQLA